jgi:hypothetical protein
MVRRGSHCSVVIPEGAGPRQGGFAGGSDCLRACVTGVSCFLIAARSVAGGRAGQGPGGARPPWAAPEASLRWPAGSPMMWRRETGAGAVRGYSVVEVRPMFLVLSSAGSAAGCSHPFALRPWPGAWGGPRQNRRSGGVNQVGARAARWRRGRQISDLAPGRWPGKAVHAACAGGGSAGADRQRICPSRRP